MCKEIEEKTIAAAKMANTQATMFQYMFVLHLTLILLLSLCLFLPFSASFNLAKLIRSMNGSIIASDLLHVNRTNRVRTLPAMISFIR